MRVLIVGAGALGGGAIAPLLLRAGHQVVFLDFDPIIYYQINSGICDVVLHGTETQVYRYQARCHTFQENIGKVDFAFTCTRPMAPPGLWAFLESLNVPVVMLENSIEIPDMARGNFLLGVADILSHKDRVFTTEDPAQGRGTIYMDSKASILGDVPGFKYLDTEDIKLLWPARFVTHNTGHCVLAYIGAKRKHKLISEAAKDMVSYMPAQEAMYEAGTALELNQDFRSWLGIQNPDTQKLHMYWSHYYETEIDRYKKFEPDTIARVARDPLRKLAYRERLLGPARAYLESTNLIPEGLVCGIKAALDYSGKNWTNILDQVCHLEQGELRRALEDYEPETRKLLWSNYSFQGQAASTLMP